MLSLVLFFLLISSGSVFATVHYGYNYEETVPITIFCGVEVVFFFGLIDQLRLGVWVVCILAVGLYTASALWIRQQKNRRKIYERLFTPALCAFFVLLLIYAYSISDRAVYLEDEFSFWAISVKKMWYTNKFACSTPKYLTFIEYPPGMQLLQYILMFLQGDFTDWRLNFAYGCYVFALAIPFLKGLLFRHPLPLILSTASIFCYGTIFYSLNNLQVDLALGATFAYGAAMLCFLKKEDGTWDPLACLSVIMSANMLVLIKSAGILFALILLSTLLLIVLLAQRKAVLKVDKQSTLTQKRQRPLQKWKPNKWNALYVVTACLPFLTKILWKVKYSVYLDLRTADFDARKYNLLEFILILLSKADGGYRGTIKNNFIQFFLTEKTQIGFLSLTNFQLSLLLGAAFFLVCYVYREDFSQRIARICTCGFLAFFAVIYWLGLLCSYMYTFSQGEGLGLASIQRYLNIYHTGALLFILFLILRGYGRFQWNPCLFCAILVIFLLLINVQSMESLLSRGNVRDSVAMNQSIQVLVNQLPKTQAGSDDDEPVVLLIHREGYPHIPVNQLRYLIYSDYFVPWECSYGSQPLFEGDYYTSIYTAEEFQAHVYELGTDYIICDYLDEDFIMQYGVLFDFPLENGQVYRVLGEKEPFALIRPDEAQ